MPKSKIIEGKQVENFLAWGSISYATGFFTVLAHTATLGIPVIEILKPIYIWTGLPLAIVVFSLKWLFDLANQRIQDVKRKIQTFSQEIMSSEKNSPNKDVDDLRTIFSEYNSSIISLFPFLTRFPLILYTKWAEKNFDKVLYKAQKNTDDKLYRKDMNNSFASLKRGVLLARLTNDIFNSVKFFLYLSIIPLACYLYIFEIYPRIPQSYGGGKPAEVIFIMDGEYIPENSSTAQTLLQNNSNLTQIKIIETKKIELLYSTTDQYYISTDNGTIMAIDKSLIKSIIWNP